MQFYFASLEDNSGKFQGLRSLFMSVKKKKASQLTVGLKL